MLQVKNLTGKSCDSLNLTSFVEWEDFKFGDELKCQSKTPRGVLKDRNGAAEQLLNTVLMLELKRFEKFKSLQRAQQEVLRVYEEMCASTAWDWDTMIPHVEITYVSPMGLNSNLTVCHSLMCLLIVGHKKYSKVYALKRA